MPDMRDCRFGLVVWHPSADGWKHEFRYAHTDAEAAVLADALRGCGRMVDVIDLDVRPHRPRIEVEDIIGLRDTRCPPDDKHTVKTGVSITGHAGLKASSARIRYPATVTIRYLRPANLPAQGTLAAASDSRTTPLSLTSTGILTAAASVKPRPRNVYWEPRFGGSWYVQLTHGQRAGRRHRVWRGPFATQEAAAEAAERIRRDLGIVGLPRRRGSGSVYWKKPHGRLPGAFVADISITEAGKRRRIRRHAKTRAEAEVLLAELLEKQVTTGATRRPELKEWQE